jgi:hypothetical protein
MTITQQDPKIMAREQRWDETITARLAGLLTELLDSLANIGQWIQPAGSR